MSVAQLHNQSRRNVLIVEDEREICVLLSDMVESQGFGTRRVQHDSQAYEALSSEEPFACMIVDVNLGSGHTGFDVARFARKIDPALPVIFVSGQTTANSVETHGVPGSLFIPKPFTLDELMSEFAKLVGDNDD